MLGIWDQKQGGPYPGGVWGKWRCDKLPQDVQDEEHIGIVREKKASRYMPI